MQLIDKAFDLLEVVALERECSVPQLARACALPISSVHRIVVALLARGYLIQLKRGRYRLGSSWAIQQADVDIPTLLREVSHDPLRQLARECRSHAHLGILEEDMVTYLAKASFTRNAVHSTVDAQLEAYCSAIGKVLLAHSGEDFLDAYLQSGDFVALTPQTVTDKSVLEQQLATIRQRGWGTEIGEIATSLMCLALPISDRFGQVHAAISISVIAPQLEEDGLLGFLPAIQRARRQIEGRVFPARKIDLP